MRYLTFVLCILFLVGCDSTDQKTIKKVKNAIGEQLKSPDSAKFSDIYIVRWKGVTSDAGYGNLAVCGVVNAKNSFGAYTGNNRFVVELSDNNGEKEPVILHMNVESSEMRRSALTSKNNDKSESLFEMLFWNMRCVDQKHPKTFTGIKK